MVPAVREEDPIRKIRVLFTLHQGMDALDFVGPYEILNSACHDPSDKSTKAFELTIASESEKTTSAQGISFSADIDMKTAHKRLSEFDVLLVPGGGTDAVLKNKSEPLQLIKSFSDLQKKNPSTERTLLSVCTAALFLASQGILAGLSATTHPDYYAALENACIKAQVTHPLESAEGVSDKTDVIEERYVVNNLRFDLGNEEELETNPYIRRRSDARRPSIAAATLKKRKGSNAYKEANSRPDVLGRRTSLRLGGLRVITSGGVSCGMDAALYLISIMVSEESAKEVERITQHEWIRGVVVDGIDI